MAGNFGLMMAKPVMLSGFIGLMGLCLVTATSIPLIRDMFYGVFKICHLVGVFSLLIGLCFHKPETVPFW